MRTLVASCALSLAACGAPLDGAALDALSAGATSGTPTIELHQSWAQAQSGALVAGGEVRVVYEAGRLPDCRGTMNDGSPAWVITAYARVNDRAPMSAVVAGRTPDGQPPSAIFELAEEGELQLWFQITNRWGCTAWDSDFGRNFRYAIGPAPSATIHFDADFSERVEGALVGGGSVTIDYALGRLPRCRQGYNGLATWDVLAFHRFDGGEVRYVPVTRPNGSERVSVPTALLVPEGARELELWFLNNDRGGCRDYDSDYGANYRFELR